MKLGIVGLGLIGGSLAKAVKAHTGHFIYGGDASQETLNKALGAGVIDEILTENTVSECEIILIALYPDDAIDFVKKNAESILPNTIVADCCGVKSKVCEAIAPIAQRGGFVFIGGHPMAGTERSGFDNSDGEIFSGASMILTPAENTKPESIEILTGLIMQIGFGSIKYTTPETHDKVIAYTSQLAHVVSSAYVKTPTALIHRGFSAGSFKDMTRVAFLNETMWTELFLENAKYLAEEIDMLAERLKDYSDAIKSGNSARLFELLKDGKEKKILSEKTE